MHSSLTWTFPAQGAEHLTWDQMQPDWRVHSMSPEGMACALISHSDQNKRASDPISFPRPSPRHGPRRFRTSPHPAASPQGGRLQPWAHISTTAGGFWLDLRLSLSLVLRFGAGPDRNVRISLDWSAASLGHRLQNPPTLSASIVTGPP